MKRLYLAFLVAILSVQVAFGEVSIFDYYSNDNAMKSLKPSFECDKATLVVDEVICCSTSCGMKTEPTLMLLDNFYTSYYNAIMSNATKEQQSKIKQIARKMIKNKKGLITSCDDGRSSAASQICAYDKITSLYGGAIADITNYLFKANKDLLGEIFLAHTDEIIALIKAWDAPAFLDKLYQYGIIDKNGKLVEKLNLRESSGESVRDSR